MVNHGEFLTQLCNVFWQYQGGFKLIIRPEARAGVVGLPPDCWEEGKPVPLDFLQENEQHMHLVVDAAGVQASLMFKGTLSRVELTWPDVALVLAPDASYQMALPQLTATKSEEGGGAESAESDDQESGEREPAKVLEFKPRGT